MATLAMIKYFVEGTDCTRELQTDAKEIKGSVIDAEKGYGDLGFGILHNPEFKDIEQCPYSTANSRIAQTTADAQTFLQSEIIQVGQPNDNGQGDLINLYYGTASGAGVDGDGNDNLEEHYNDIDDDDEPVAANVWEMMNSNGGNLITYCGNCYASGDHGFIAGLGVDWASHVNLGAWMYDDNTGRYFDIAAQGSVAQWSPFIHLSGGDPTALNADAFLG